jgi:hypothetical protein
MAVGALALGCIVVGCASADPTATEGQDTSQGDDVPLTQDDADSTAASVEAQTASVCKKYTLTASVTVPSTDNPLLAPFAGKKVSLTLTYPNVTLKKTSGPTGGGADSPIAKLTDLKGPTHLAITGPDKAAWKAALAGAKPSLGWDATGSTLEGGLYLGNKQFTLDVPLPPTAVDSKGFPTVPTGTSQATITLCQYPGGPGAPCIEGDASLTAACN